MHASSTRSPSPLVPDFWGSTHSWAAATDQRNQEAASRRPGVPAGARCLSDDQSLSMAGALISFWRKRLCPDNRRSGFGLTRRHSNRKLTSYQTPRKRRQRRRPLPPAHRHERLQAEERDRGPEFMSSTTAKTCQKPSRAPSRLTNCSSEGLGFPR